MMADLILVLNLGLKSIRSILFDLEGRKLAHASLPVQTALKEDRVEQDPCEWWEKGVTVMQETARYRNLGREVAYLTVTASSSCLVPVDGAGAVLGPAIMVSDRRAKAQSLLLAEQAEFAAVQQAVGLEPDASLMLPKILWLQEHAPELAQAVKWFLSPNDYLAYRLTGQVVTDRYNAQKYHFDIERKVYPSRLLEVLGIPEERLPRVAECGSVTGEVLGEVAAKLGLRPGVQVVLSTYDAICAFHGSGPGVTGEACDVSGTVSSLRTFAVPTSPVEAQGLQSIPWPGNAQSIVGGSNNLGGGLIEWAKQCFFTREEYPYEVMEKEAKESSFGARGLIFLPYLMGERAPLWDSEARGVFFGLERYHTRGDMAEAILESAGFTVRHLLQAMENCGVKVQRIRVSGGLSRIGHVSQLKAHITGLEIAVVDEFETTALGAALICAVGVGLIPDLQEAAKRVRIRMVIHPDAERHRMFEELFGLYRGTYEALQPLFVRRRQILANLHEVVETGITNL